MIFNRIMGSTTLWLLCLIICASCNSNSKPRSEFGTIAHPSMKNTTDYPCLYDTIWPFDHFAVSGVIIHYTKNGKVVFTTEIANQMNSQGSPIVGGAFCDATIYSYEKCKRGDYAYENSVSAQWINLHSLAPEYKLKFNESPEFRKHIYKQIQNKWSQDSNSASEMVSFRVKRYKPHLKNYIKEEFRWSCNDWLNDKKFRFDGNIRRYIFNNYKFDFDYASYWKCPKTGDVKKYTVSVKIPFCSNGKLVYFKKLD